MDVALAYAGSVLALGAMALLMLVQLLVADVIGIRAKHVPGTPVLADHQSLLFRTTRTVANTNESIAVFILAILFCILSGASPAYTAYAAWAFVLSRALYAVFYYCNLQTLRLSLVAMLILGFSA